MSTANRNNTIDQKAATDCYTKLVGFLDGHTSKEACLSALSFIEHRDAYTDEKIRNIRAILSQNKIDTIENWRYEVLVNAQAIDEAPARIRYFLDKTT